MLDRKLRTLHVKIIEDVYDDLGEWLESFEDLDDWMDEFEKEETLGEEEKEEIEKLIKTKKKSIKEQEDDLFAENIRRKEKLDEDRANATNNTSGEWDLNRKMFSARDKERRSWLEEECKKIHGEGEDARLCFINEQYGKRKE